jgi:hypothetical protein
MFSKYLGIQLNTLEWKWARPGELQDRQRHLLDQKLQEHLLVECPPRRDDRAGVAARGSGGSRGAGGIWERFLIAYRELGQVRTRGRSRDGARLSCFFC